MDGHDNLLCGRWREISGCGQKRYLLRRQMLDDHRHHLTDVLEGFLACDAPGSSAVVEQRRAVGVPCFLGRLDNNREGVGAGFGAHATRVASLSLAVRTKPLGTSAAGPEIPAGRTHRWDGIVGAPQLAFV